MRATSLTPGSPYPLRLWAYLQERFPPLAYGVMIVSYFSSNQFLATALSCPAQPVRYGLHSLLGAVTLLCLFFHLRVFDEHKDYADDCRYHPDRVLQRGLVTLRELRLLGGAAIALELLLAAASGAAALLAVVLALLYSLLMLQEFLVPRWLQRHFLVYTGAHMLIMPLFALVVYSFATGRAFWTAPAWFWLYGLVGFCVTLNWEVSRKIRAPGDEIEGVTTYSRVFGTYGAAYLVILIRVVDTGLVALVGWHLGLGTTFYTALAGLFCVCLVGFFQYRLRTSSATARRLEAYAGLYIVAFDLILAIAIVRRFGITL